MEDDNKIDIVIGKLQKPERKTDSPLKKNRSTYTEGSAESVKPILDKLMNDPTDVFVPSVGSGYTVRTLYCKINDAIKWLMQNTDEPERSEYCLLRSQVSIRAVHDSDNSGVLIYFKEGMRKLRQKSGDGRSLEFATTDSGKWRHDVIRWLKSAKDGDMFESGTLEEFLTEQDEAWILQTLAGIAPDAESVVKEKSFRIIR